jgi:hypothetical protein
MFRRWKPTTAWACGGLVGALVGIVLTDAFNMQFRSGYALLFYVACAAGLAAIFPSGVAFRDWRERRQAGRDGVDGKWWLTLGERQ